MCASYRSGSALGWSPTGPRPFQRRCVDLGGMTLWWWLQFGGYFAETIGIGLAVSVVKSFGPTVFMNFGPGRKRLQIASGPAG